jgi:transposase-like protein
MLKAIHAQESLPSARLKAADIVDQLKQMRLGKAATLVEEAIEETLTYYRFPDNHWVSIRTNNPMERIILEIRRRARVVGAFPDGQSAVMFCAARLRHIAGTKWGTRRYLNMETLKHQQLEEQPATA